MKNFVALLLLVAVGVGVYVYLQNNASDNVRMQMAGIINDMKIPPKWKEDAQAMLADVHEKAFDAALDISQRLGRKFDDKAYYDKVFELMEQRATEEGKTDLADKLAEQKKLFSLKVTEH